MKVTNFSAFPRIDSRRCRATSGRSTGVSRLEEGGGLPPQLDLVSHGAPGFCYNVTDLGMLRGDGPSGVRGRSPEKETVQTKTPTERLNVLFIIKPLRWSGADKVLLDAAQALNPERYRVIYGLISSNPAEEIPAPAGAPVVTFPMPGLNGPVWVKFFLQLCRVLKQYRISILHVNSYHPGNYGRLAGVLSGVPVIIDHWHGFTRFNRKRKTLCRWLGRFTDLSFAVSRGVRDYVASECRLDPARFKVLYNCLDPDRYRRGEAGRMRQGLGLPPDLPVVGLVARLDHWAKGHRELFRAMDILRGRQPFHALIVGGGRRQGEMQEMVENLQLSRAVHFLGNRLDIPELLGAMDIFVLPSYSEGVSRALLEAMAAGLPVIASEVGGLPEIVRPGETGLLIPPRSPEALAEALAGLLADPARAAALGERARAYVQANFSLERLARDLNASYDEVSRRKLGA